MSEATTEKTWTAHGLDCAVVLVDLTAGMPAGLTGLQPHRCGYCRIPEDHPWFEVEREESDVDVHGGLTFSGDKPRILEDGWWIGFDCAHFADNPERWTLDAVVTETEQMAEQVACVTGEEADHPRGEPHAETDPENWPDGRPTYGRGR